MELKLLIVLAVAAALATSASRGETLLSGSVYFDSENTLVEVRDLIKAGDTNSLARLFKANHISDKTTQDLAVILLYADPETVEFRFADNPTTYWTYAKYLTANVSPASASPTPSPGPDSTLPADLPSSLTSASIHLPAASPTPTPSPDVVPTPTPTLTPRPSPPSPKSRVAQISEPKEENAENDGVPEKYKVWHQVNGHWKWYDKRHYHEVRRALPIGGTPLATTPVSVPVPAATPPPSAPQSTPSSTPHPTNPAPRALPARP